MNSKEVTNHRGFVTYFNKYTLEVLSECSIHNDKDKTSTPLNI